jgi:hypothetical protein
MDIYIHRNPNEIETPGSLTVPDKHFGCLSLELPDNGNKQGVSCYPNGTYPWRKVPATAKIPYEHIAIDNIPGRSGCCIHVGNFASLKKTDVLGCTLVGTAFADINGDGIPDITNSRPTFKKLMDILPDSGNLIVS